MALSAKPAEQWSAKGRGETNAQFSALFRHRRVHAPDGLRKDNLAEEAPRASGRRPRGVPCSAAGGVLAAQARPLLAELLDELQAERAAGALVPVDCGAQEDQVRAEECLHLRHTEKQSIRRKGEKGRWDDLGTGGPARGVRAALRPSKRAVHPSPSPFQPPSPGCVRLWRGAPSGAGWPQPHR